MRERHTVRPIIRLLFPGLAACVLMASAPTLFAGPADQNPDLPLDARPVNEERIAKAITEERARRLEMQNVAQKAADQKWASSFPATIRETHIAALQLDRLGDQLIIVGETAGADFKARAAYLQQLVSEAVSDARKIPNMSSKMQQDKKRALAAAEARAKRISAIESLTKRGKWEQAEENLYQNLDEISSMALWYYPADRLKMLGPFQSLRKKIDAEMAKQRTEAGQQAIQGEIEARLPDLDGLVSQVKTAAEAVRSGGMADFGGEMMTGPQLLQRYGDEWKKTAVVLMQCRALNAARADAPDGASLPAADALEEKEAEFAGQMALALAALIEADAEQVAEPQVREHYVAYLPVVGLVNTLSPEDKLAEAALPALDRLAGRSSVLASEAEAYRAATDDLLRWRRRITQAYADREKEDFPAAQKQLTDASSEEVPLRNAIPATSRNSQQTGVRDFPVWSMLEAVSPKLIGEPLRAGPFMGLPTSSKIAVSSYTGRALVQCAVADHLDAELDLLKTGLLVDETSPPLSLAAATAVATAERGDLVAVGGNIEQVAVDAVISRFRDLSGALWPLALDDFQTDPATSANPLEQILFRFTIRPVWLQHEYLFARVEGETVKEDPVVEEAVE